MRTLNRIRTVSLRVAPQWVMCVFFGAYVTLQIVSAPGTVAL
jgi:hypothetical protein